MAAGHKASPDLFPGEFGKRSYSAGESRIADSSHGDRAGQGSVRSLRTRIGSYVAHVDSWPEISLRFPGDDFAYPQPLVAIGALTRGRAKYVTADGRELLQQPGQGLFLPGSATVDMTFAEGAVTAGFLVPVDALLALGAVAPVAPTLLQHPSVSVSSLHSLAHAAVAQHRSVALHQQELIARAVDALVIAVGVENGYYGAASESTILTRMRIQAYLASHFADTSLSVDSVAAEFRLSRRSLQRIFEGAGTGLWREVMRLRTEHATSLMSDPGTAALSLDRIRLLSGFSTPSQFRRAILEATGLSPSELRRHALDEA